LSGDGVAYDLNRVVTFEAVLACGVACDGRGAEKRAVHYARILHSVISVMSQVQPTF